MLIEFSKLERGTCFQDLATGLKFIKFSDTHAHHEDDDEQDEHVLAEFNLTEIVDV